MIREDTLKIDWNQPEEQSIIPRGNGNPVNPNYRRDLNEALKRHEESDRDRLTQYKMFGGIQI